MTGRLTGWVSAVVVTRDRAPMLAQSLASVRAQLGGPVDIVVVDDGSRDGTPALLDRQPDVRVVRHSVPVGVAAARNSGLDLVCTPWVAFLDDDDLWAPDKLLSQQVALRAEPAARWCYVGAMVIDADLRLLGGLHAQYVGDVRREILAANVVTGGGSSVLAETRAVRDTGGFDPQIRRFEDWDLWIRLALSSPVAAVDRPLVGYREHIGGKTSRPSGAATSVLFQKYAAERAQLGVLGPPAGLDQALRARVLISGSRRASAATFAAAAKTTHSAELAVGAAIALASPAGLRSLINRRWRARTPPDWLSEVEIWLDPLRSPADRGERSADVVGKSTWVEDAGP